MRHQVAARQAGAFLHDVAQLSGEHQRALLGGARDSFDFQGRPAHAGPRQAGDDPGEGFNQQGIVAHLRLAEVTRQRFGRDRTFAGVAFGAGLGDLAADLGDDLFELTYAGFACVVAHQWRQDGFGKRDIAALEPVFGALFRNEVIGGDHAFFGFDVTCEPNDFHAITQGFGNAAQLIRGADEQHLRQINANIQVVIKEVLVLLWI